MSGKKKIAYPIELPFTIQEPILLNNAIDKYQLHKELIDQLLNALKGSFHDFNVIKDKICAGKAHELSEGDTLYLGAATKAATSEDRREQPFSDELAKPRAFAFKNSYMTYVQLFSYLLPGVKIIEHNQFYNPADF